jgi:hypothetical protein
MTIPNPSPANTLPELTALLGTSHRQIVNCFLSPSSRHPIVLLLLLTPHQKQTKAMPEFPKTLEQIKWIREIRREEPNRKKAVWEGPDGMTHQLHTLQQYIDKPNDTTYFKLNRLVNGKSVPSLPIGQPRSYMLLYAAGRIWSSENNGTKSCRLIEGHLN